MKRFISMFVVLCFTANAFAGAAGVMKLERAIDEHQYTMTVEWDQKDQQFATKERERFQTVLKEIFESSKITQEDMDTVLAKRIPRKQTLDNLRLDLALKGITTQAELQDYLRLNSSELYGKGASWNGGVSSGVIWGAVGILIVGAIVFIAWDSERCLEWKDEYFCRDTESCSGGGIDDHETCWTTGSECGMFPRCQQRESR